MKAKSNDNRNQQAEDHKKITKDNTSTNQMEWRKYGDNFQKFTLYKNYTPVEISNNTKIIKHP